MMMMMTIMLMIMIPSPFVNEILLALGREKGEGRRRRLLGRRIRTTKLFSQVAQPITRTAREEGISKRGVEEEKGERGKKDESALAVMSRKQAAALMQGLMSCNSIRAE